LKRDTLPPFNPPKGDIPLRPRLGYREIFVVMRKADSMRKKEKGLFSSDYHGTSKKQ